MFLLSWINIHDILSFYPKINTFHKTSFHIPLLSQQFDLFYRFQSGLPVTDSKYVAIHVNYCGFIKVDPRLVCQEPPAGCILYNVYWYYNLWSNRNSKLFFSLNMIENYISCFLSWHSDGKLQYLKSYNFSVCFGSHAIYCYFNRYETYWL